MKKRRSKKRSPFYPNKTLDAINSIGNILQWIIIFGGTIYLIHTGEMKGLVNNTTIFGISLAVFPIEYLMDNLSDLNAFLIMKLTNSETKLWFDHLPYALRLRK